MLRLWRALHESKWTLTGALIFDPAGRLLLVRNRQRRAWEYPAGAVSGGESPLIGCQREVLEEVNLHVKDLRFLGVDYSTRPGAPGGALFFTFAAHVSHAEAKQVRLQLFEATAHRWVTCAEALDLLEPRLQSRLRLLLEAYDSQVPVYLHDGQQPA